VPESEDPFLEKHPTIHDVKPRAALYFNLPEILVFIFGNESGLNM